MKSVFDEVKQFEEGRHATTRLASMALRDVLRGRRGARVLDVGTGDGVLAAVAMAAGAGEVVGVDHEREAVAAARRNVPVGRFLHGDAGDWLRELGGGFDVVVANLPDPPLRVLIPGLAAAARFGTLIVTGAQLWQADFVSRALVAAGAPHRPPHAADGWVMFVSDPRYS